ncbi:hypothetical protein, partial [Legionella tunisiensis]|uniref:hypothetical protein n=1 Tax=Legionella tunisiensis TaxID=1034944 RepID=UPI001E58D683
ASAAETVKRHGKEPSLTNVCEELGIPSLTPELSSLLEKWYHTQPEFQRSINAPLSNNIKIETSEILEKILSWKNPCLCYEQP